jgi:hypothetical protein
LVAKWILDLIFGSVSFVASRGSSAIWNSTRAVNVHFRDEERAAPGDGGDHSGESEVTAEENGDKSHEPNGGAVEHTESVGEGISRRHAGL